MKRRKKVGIFGGTFDPPHLGHLRIAETAVRQLKLDLLFFVPAHVPPHKRGHGATSGVHRLAMLRAMARGNPRFKVSAVEIRRGGISYTIDTVEAFHRRYPRAALYVIMGADNLADFPRWKNPQRILALSTLAVYRRPGIRRLREEAVVLKGKRFPMSSTAIRSVLRRGGSADRWLAGAVMRYVRKHGLYRIKPGQNHGTENSQNNCIH